ncbi:GNAT family N-acetyltransferase [Aestuariimicrobium kwangyangense]|uniref:GNAT family N-acetyltransferase n=1 Tax=Aestuariimicrobium kwangyangense TaxID=396389 RepID=UPI0003B3F039|nr:GNAT family N-acetyltransferase [Aestuariimicrobium kwangyangense]
MPPDRTVRIRRATPGDAESYARCREQSMAAAYAHFMPQEFFDRRLERFDELVADYARDIADVDSHAHWMATDEAGRVLGICTIAAAPAQWERDLGLPEPPVQRELAQLYLTPDAQGSGLAQDLLRTALPPEQEAYLWCMWKNPRAEAFYLRQGFVHDGVEVSCGPTWFDQRMFRMWRPRRPRA